MSGNSRILLSPQAHKRFLEYIRACERVLDLKRELREARREAFRKKKLFFESD